MSQLVHYPFRQAHCRAPCPRWQRVSLCGVKETTLYNTWTASPTRSAPPCKTFPHTPPRRAGVRMRRRPGCNSSIRSHRVVSPPMANRQAPT